MFSMLVVLHQLLRACSFPSLSGLLLYLFTKPRGWYSSDVTFLEQGGFGQTFSTTSHRVGGLVGPAMFHRVSKFIT